MTKSTKGKISFVSALSSVSALIAIFVFIFGIPSIPDFFKGEKISTQAIDTEKVKEATISSKYAPENFLSGSWINDSCIISIQKEKNSWIQVINATLI